APEPRRGLGRAAPLVRRSRPEGHRSVHGVADRLGPHGPVCPRPPGDPGRRPRARVPAPDATGGRVLVRRELDGHWLPEGLLPPLSPLRLLFPAPRLLPLPPERGPRAARGGVCALRAG